MQQNIKQSERLDRFLADVAGLFKATLNATQQDLIKVVVEDKDSDDNSQYVEALLYWYEFACYLLYRSEFIVSEYDFYTLIQPALASLKAAFPKAVDISAFVHPLEHHASFYINERLDGYIRANKGALQPKGSWWFGKAEGTIPAPMLLLGDYMLYSQLKSQPAINADLQTLYTSDPFEKQIIAEVIATVLVPNLYKYANMLRSLCSEYSLDMHKKTTGR